MDTLLLGDIGGTNARFMLAPAQGALPSATILHTADFPTLEAALASLLGPGASLRATALSVAGPVRDGLVRMTNCPWVISAAGLTAATGLADPILINDFAALAHGVPSLGPGEIRRVGPGDVLVAKGPIGILGPGTGLGMAALVPDGRGGHRVVAGEGGHADLPAMTQREMAVLALLQRQHGHVSIERVLSGPGLEALYAALAVLDEGKPQICAAPEIDARALARTDPRAAETIALFTGLLGAVAGNLALTLGAEGGIYLAGGILPRWGALFDETLFRRRFEAKGRFAEYLGRIPTAIITAPDVAFRGLRALAMAEKL
jgi:glucokinase